MYMQLHAKATSRTRNDVQERMVAGCASLAGSGHVMSTRTGVLIIRILCKARYGTVNATGRKCNRYYFRRS